MTKSESFLKAKTVAYTQENEVMTVKDAIVYGQLCALERQMMIYRKQEYVNDAIDTQIEINQIYKENI